VRGLKSNSSPGARVRALGLCLLALASGHACAQWSTTQPPVYSQMGRVVTAAPGAALASGSPLDALLQGRTYTPKSPVTGAVDIASVTKGISPVPGGVPINVTMKRALQWSAIARGAARALPLISTAIAIKELMDEVRCREAPGGASECDTGSTENVQYVYCLTASGTKYCSPLRETSLQQTADRLSVVSSNGGQYTFSPGACDLAYPSYGRCAINQRNNYNGGAISVWGYVAFSRESALACNPVVINGVTLVPVKGTDGMCPDGVYEPATPQQVESRVENYGGKVRAPAVVQALDKGGIPVEHPSPVYEPPAAIQGGRETTQLPDGRTITRDTDYPIEATPEGYQWRDRIVEREWPAGVVPEPPGSTGGTVPPGTTTTGSPTSPGAPAPVEFKTCGLPDTPPCKIDETGTPAPNVSDWIDPAVVGVPLRSLVDAPDVADTKWTFTFSLPAACSVLTVGTFGGREISIDLCQYQPMIHELIGLLWIGATFWFSIGLVFRAFA